jgi:hypothetical protein
VAVYQVACTDATLTMDTGTGLITIDRKGKMPFNMPARTEIKIGDLTKIEHKFFGAIESRGSGGYKFIYPGCPEGGDLLTGFSSHENIVQYSGKHKKEADDFNAALKSYVASQKARASDDNK